MRAPIDFYSAFASYFARNIYLCCTFAKVSKPELCFKSFSICSFFGNKSSSWYLFLFWFCWSISYNQYDTGKFIYKKVYFLVLETNDISSFSLQICDHRCYLIFQMLLQMRTIIYVEKNLLPPFSLVRYKPEFLDSNPKLLPNRSVCRLNKIEKDYAMYCIKHVLFKKVKSRLGWKERIGTIPWF